MSDVMAVLNNTAMECAGDGTLGRVFELLLQYGNQ